MRICIYGAGATGGHLAVRLAAAGHDVSVVARGPHLAAIQANGLTLEAGEERVTQRVAASDDPARLGPQELVIVSVKATALPAVAESLPHLLGPETRVLFSQNGIPWWYPLGQDAAALPRLPVFRLGEAFLRHLPGTQVLGGPIYSANAVAAPGVVRNASVGANRLEFAEVAGPAGAAEPIRAALRAAGIGAPNTGDARRATWKKLLGNISGSALALVTGTQASAVAADPMLRVIYARIVAEGLAIAAAHGHDLASEISTDRMLAGRSAHKPSLLQDLEAGRPMEIAEILLAPLAFARAAKVPTPTLDAVAAVATRIASDRGLFDPAGMAGVELW